MLKKCQGLKVSVTSFLNEVYLVMGIDELGSDHVLSVHRSYESAKIYCIHTLALTEYYDLWVEKHRVA